jgi:hypothetical protein
MPSGHATFVHSQSEKTNTPAGDLLDAERLFLLFRKKVRNWELLSASTMQLLQALGITGRLTVILHNGMDPESQSPIVRIVFSRLLARRSSGDFRLHVANFDEAIFGCTLRTLTRRFSEAIDRMTQILIDCGLLERIGTIKSRGRICAQETLTVDLPSIDLEEIDACSEYVYPIPVPDSFIYANVEV